MTKSHIIYAFSSVVLLAAALVFLAASRSRKEKPELPIMQQFSATPRFENQQTIFGKTYDLSHPHTETCQPFLPHPRPYS